MNRTACYLFPFRMRTMPRSIERLLPFESASKISQQVTAKTFRREDTQSDFLEVLGGQPGSFFGLPDLSQVGYVAICLHSDPDARSTNCRRPSTDLRAPM